MLIDNQLPLALLYAGPDQILPLASALGGLIGVLLIWWSRVAALFARLGRAVFRRSEQTPSAKQG